MPVVELGLARLQKLLSPGSGKRITQKTIVETLPFLGLDMESQSAGTVRVEYSPNRPDYSTDYGIALGLEGLLGIRTGSADLRVLPPQGQAGDRGRQRPANRRHVRADPSVLRVRPCITGMCAAAAPGTRVDAHMIKQLMAMQEDLHAGIGRGRKKSSIGIHDLDAASFPLTYTTVSRDHRMTPLHETKPMTVRTILSDTDTGRRYGGLLGGASGPVPVLLDSKGATVSLPPIINSSSTAVTTQTRNLLVEVTGMDRGDVEDALSVVSAILQRAGFALHRLGVSGAGNSAPALAPRRITISPGLACRSLGLQISPSAIVSCLRRSRITAVYRGGRITCTIPRYRFDIMGPMDVVEEVALGYGIARLEPRLLPSQTVGGAGAQTLALRTVDDMMTGLGYTEALNSCLSGEDALYGASGRPADGAISVLDSKSLEHTVLRDSLLPGLVSNLSRNVHHSYPQRLYETGTAFNRGEGKGNTSIQERTHLAAVAAHKDADFSELKSALLAVLDAGFCIKASTRTSARPLFEDGMSADIVAAAAAPAGGKGRRGGGGGGSSSRRSSSSSGKSRTVGTIGQMSSEMTRRLRIRVPVAGFEVELAGLIFD